MAIPDVDETGRDGETRVSQLPGGAHAPMSIGRVTEGSAGQPMPVDGTAGTDSDPKIGRAHV